MTVFKKSLLTLGGMAISFSAILVVSMLVFMNSLYYEINTTGLKNTAKTLMSATGEEKLAEIFADNENIPALNIDIPLNANSAYRLTLILPTGYVLWDSHVQESLVNHIDREEIKAALEGREQSARRNSISTKMKLIYYALPVFDGEEIVGVFRLSEMVPGFSARISSVLIPFVVFTFIMISAVLFAIFMFSRSLLKSLGRLVDITKTGTSLLSNPDTEPVDPEFRSLEKAIRAVALELHLRLDQAKSESQRLEAILNGMSEAVFAMDSQLILHLVNPLARKLFNLGNKDINTMSFLEATRCTELEDIAKKALASGTNIEKELTFRSGAEQQFIVYAAPLSGTSSGNGSGVVLVMQEITRLVKLERIRKDFVANVSHELRTPIQLIKGFSETLLDSIPDTSDEEKQKIHFVNIINKNANVMENLTNDLLILADLENSSTNIREMEELNVASIIHEAVSSVEPQKKRKQIEINIECPDDLKACFHSSFITQALINLVDNAIKYSKDNSKIWVSAFVENSKHGIEELVLQVRDKGIGISAQHLERVFERFYRVDKSRSKEEGGTGLGLSIVRHIALLHKGTAEVESHAGEGSIFRIKIPAFGLKT